MRVVVQRVAEAKVEIDGECVGGIERGLTVLVAFTHGDARSDLEYIADKVANLRIFPDAEGKMNYSVTDIGGGVLLVPNFTLYGDCRRGRRPSFSDAGEPEASRERFEEFVAVIAERGIQCAQGRFGAHMAVTLVNDGPVTLLLDSGDTKKRTPCHEDDVQ